MEHNLIEINEDTIKCSCGVTFRNTEMTARNKFMRHIKRKYIPQEIRDNYKKLFKELRHKKSIEEIQARQQAWRKEYYRRPEVKKRLKEYFNKPDVKEHIKEYREEYIKNHKEEIRDYHREYHKRPKVKKFYQEYHQRPEVKERIKERNQSEERREYLRNYYRERYHKNKVKK